MKTFLEDKQNGALHNGVFSSRQDGRHDWIWLVAGAIGLWAAGAGRAQQVSYPLPFYEPFPTAASASGLPYNGFAYENNEELGQGVSEALGNGYAACSSNVWTFGNSISSSCGRCLGTNGLSGLEYPGLTNVDATYQTGLFSMYPKDTSSTKNRAVSLIIPTNNPSAPLSVYASCLINIQTNQNDASTEPFPFFGLTASGNGSSVNQSGAVVYLNTAFQLQLSKNSSTASTNATPALVVSNTYLIVLRYQYNPGSNDQVDLWVDPIALGANAAPPPTMTITNNANLASNFFGAVAIFEFGNPPQIFLDEIRVATNWAGVTPAFPAPGNIYNVTGGGGGCAGASFPVGLSGSDNGVTYFLYTNGLPTGQSVNGTGSAITFGGQSTTANYTVLGSNNATSYAGWMASNAALSVLSPPSITTEPIPVVVATNGLAVFTAVSPSMGSGFQWFRNGTSLVDGGDISGSQTPTLVIFPAGAGDAFPTAQGYHLVVTNPCGAPTYSTTNGLTLDAPATKVWVGDGNSNFWDAAVSTNWAISSGAPATAVFNFGDNVIFDDTSPNPNVTLNNSYLSPSTITVNGVANAFVFGGPGGLAGPGSIVMNSAASLTLSTPNSETGGIVISNGILNFSRASYLGQGTITLAGGQLAAPNIGAVIINNQINVTSTNSAIGVNSTGGQNLTLTNLLNGISGNLTFVNNTTKAATPLIILTYPTFTFNLPVDINVGPAGGGLILAAENTSGVQTWNGVITDAGQIERNGAGGTTLLNNTNTFTGGVLLDNGSLGVGASTIFVSPATTPPTIVCGPLGTGTLTIGTGAGTAPALFAAGGPQMVGNAMAFAADAVGLAFVINGSENLTLSGNLDLYGTNRTLEIDNTGATILSGVIFDSVNDEIPAPAGGLTKSGAGTLYLDGDMYNGLTDTSGYTIVYGAITNSAGAMAGSGTLAGPVVVLSGAAIGAGDAGQIGTLTISNNLTLQGGANFRISKTAVGVKSSDLIAGISNVIYGGTLVVSNVGTGALAVGDTFKLFSATASSGNFASITGGAATFSFNPGTGMLTVASLIATAPTNLSFSVTNSTLSLSWPANYLGWTLQTNSINIAVPGDWFAYPGSTTNTTESIPINPSSSNVFFRLTLP